MGKETLNKIEERGGFQCFRSTFRELSDSIPKEKIEKIAQTTGTFRFKKFIELPIWIRGLGFNFRFVQKKMSEYQ